MIIKADLNTLFADDNDGTVINPDGVDWSHFIAKGVITEGPGGPVIGYPTSVENNVVTAVIQPSKVNVGFKPDGNRAPISVEGHRMRYGIAGRVLARDSKGNVTKMKPDYVAVLPPLKGKG